MRASAPWIYLFLLANVLAGRAAVGLEITHVYAQPDYLADGPAPVEIRFTLSESAHVKIEIFDGRDYLVRTLEPRQGLGKGDSVLIWDGKDGVGRPVPPGEYRYTVIADDQGEQVEYDPTELTGGEQLVAKDVVWDPQAKLIRYRLSRPARVNIRVGLRDDGPLLGTVLDWVSRNAGDHAERWEGWDASGVLDLTHHPRLQISVTAYSLSDNVILVGPPPRKVELIHDLPWGKIARRVKGNAKKRMHFHSQQPLETRGDYAISLRLPSGLPHDKEGIPIVSGIVPVRLDVSAQDRDRALARRFEPAFFVDGTFTFENEIGFLPMTWRWDTTTINEGIHFLTANLRGYEGNFGVTTVKVSVRHKTEQDRQGGAR